MRISTNATRKARGEERPYNSHICDDDYKGPVKKRLMMETEKGGLTA
jgi:hypothetical protein